MTQLNPAAKQTLRVQERLRKIKRSIDNQIEQVPNIKGIIRKCLKINLNESFYLCYCDLMLDFYEYCKMPHYYAENFLDILEEKLGELERKLGENDTN
jgi:hypothetical protein